MTESRTRTKGRAFAHLDDTAVSVYCLDCARMSATIRDSHLSVARRSANSMSMNLRHSAALVLVGWYLLSPQISWENRECKAHLELPVASWNRSKITSSSKGECEDHLARIRKDFEVTGIIGRRLRQEVRTEYEKAMAASFCVATDDPRLKEN